MAALTNDNNPARVLMIGESKSGKTGSLASLAKAGYNLRILDFDNGTEILYHLLKSDAAASSRVDIEKCMDDFTQNAGSIVYKLPLKAFAHSLKCLDNWPGLGNPRNWGTKDILVIDSLTFLGEACMRYVLTMNGKIGTSWDAKAGPTEPNWGSAIGLQEDVLAAITGESFKCHVIVMSHIITIDINGVGRGFPSALGRKLPQKVGRYFNHALLVKSPGPGQPRQIYTDTQGTIELGSPMPGIAKPAYPITTGMADYFKDLYGPLKP